MSVPSRPHGGRPVDIWNAAVPARPAGLGQPLRAPYAALAVLHRDRVEQRPPPRARRDRRVPPARWCRAGRAGSPARRRRRARAPCAAARGVSTPSATTNAPQRPARSRSERSTACEESRWAPSWTSDRSSFTMSKRNWLSRRRPALPAPTSSAAIRMPASWRSSRLRRSRPMSCTISRSVTSMTMRRGSIPCWASAARMFATPKSGASIVRGDRFRLMILSAGMARAASATTSKQAASSSTVRPTASGGLEHLARVAEWARLGGADQALVAEDLAGDHVDDRLEDRAKPSLDRNLDHGSGHLLGSRLVGLPVALRLVGVDRAHARAACTSRARRRPACRAADASSRAPGTTRCRRRRTCAASRRAAGRPAGAGVARPASRLRVGVRHQDRELVAADPEGAVGVADHLGDEAPHPLEQLVARRVALRVVDELEVVEVEDQQRDRHAIPAIPVDLAVELLLEAHGGYPARSGRPGASPRAQPCTCARARCARSRAARRDAGSGATSTPAARRRARRARPASPRARSGTSARSQAGGRPPTTPARSSWSATSAAPAAQPWSSRLRHASSEPATMPGSLLVRSAGPAGTGCPGEADVRLSATMAPLVRSTSSAKMPSPSFGATDATSSGSEMSKETTPVGRVAPGTSRGIAMETRGSPPGPRKVAERATPPPRSASVSARRSGSSFRRLLGTDTCPFTIRSRTTPPGSASLASATIEPVPTKRPQAVACPIERTRIERSATEAGITRQHLEHALGPLELRDDRRRGGRGPARGACPHIEALAPDDRVDECARDRDRHDGHGQERQSKAQSNEGQAPTTIGRVRCARRRRSRQSRHFLSGCYVRSFNARDRAAAVARTSPPEVGRSAERACEPHRTGPPAPPSRFERFPNDSRLSPVRAVTNPRDGCPGGLVRSGSEGCGAS